MVAQAVCGVLSACMVFLLLLKVVLCPRLVRDDLGNSIAASVLGTLFMSIMLLSGYIAGFAYVPALAVWGAAVLGHVVLIIWFTSRFVRRFRLVEVFPTYFICYVGIMVASVTSPTFDQVALGTVLFWFGFACYVVLFGVVTWRYARHAVPEAARPLFCIYAAPMSLSLVAYLAISEGPDVVFVIVLLVLAQMLYFFVLFHVPKFLRLDFYPSYAAMTFPFVISATALTRATALLSDTVLAHLDVPALESALGALAICETVIAVCLVAYVLVHYILFFAREFAAPGASDVIEEQEAEEGFREFFED